MWQTSRKQHGFWLYLFALLLDIVNTSQSTWAYKKPELYIKTGSQVQSKKPQQTWRKQEKKEVGEEKIQAMTIQS